MFGVDFSEVALIFIVALVVLGPTRLPGLVRKVGRWVGKARSMARDFQQQLESEINIDELNRTTRKTVEEALAITPPATPAAAQSDTVDEDAKKLAASAYPHGAVDPAPASLAAEPAPAPGDDTYSHAHGHDSTPMPEPADATATPEAGPACDGQVHNKDNAAA